MTEYKPRHLAYLLRLWLTEERADPTHTPETVWRVSLEDLTTHTRHGFASLDRAFAFLHHQVRFREEDSDEQD